MERKEFGVARSSCACEDCQTNCRFMPGFLIPADLARIIPAGENPFRWAATNLLASPGALVGVEGIVFRIGTLVPAVKEDGSCINLIDGRCTIHEAAPFGCAFFSCQTETPYLSKSGLLAIMNAPADSLYRRLWDYLDKKGKRQYGPEVLRSRMAAALQNREQINAL